MEKEKEVMKQQEVAELERWCKSVPTNIGENGTMYVRFGDWQEISESAEKTGGEIYMLRKRNGERAYKVLGRQYEPYDRRQDFADTFTKGDDIYEDCYKAIIIELAEEGKIGELEELVKNASQAIRLCEQLTDDEFLVVCPECGYTTEEHRINPMEWNEDVYEYAFGLFITEEE